MTTVPYTPRVTLRAEGIQGMLRAANNWDFGLAFSTTVEEFLHALSTTGRLRVHKENNQGQNQGRVGGGYL